MAESDDEGGNRLIISALFPKGDQRYLNLLSYLLFLRTHLFPLRYRSVFYSTKVQPKKQKQKRNHYKHNTNQSLVKSKTHIQKIPIYTDFIHGFKIDSRLHLLSSEHMCSLQGYRITTDSGVF
ncbi:hypothetical protein L6452_20698 [Arctium lappa]|uniref:Uncharacterized protein n=1 Tax=Arctium lappa TaxID=4217 RepID=A0ACB9BDZ4_ARCLA|nr:hypothetical protein L6452_20698 [Arctium lappa]